MASTLLMEGAIASSSRVSRERSASVSTIATTRTSTGGYPPETDLDDTTSLYSHTPSPTGTMSTTTNTASSLLNSNPASPSIPPPSASSASSPRYRQLPQPPTNHNHLTLRSRPSRGELFMKAMMEESAIAQDVAILALKGEEGPTSPTTTTTTTTNTTSGTGTATRTRSNTQTQGSTSGTRSRSGSMLLAVPGQGQGQAQSQTGTTASGSLTFRPRKQDDGREGGQGQGRSRGASTALKSPMGSTLTVPTVNVSASGSGTAGGTGAGTSAGLTSGPLIPPGARYRHTPRMPHHHAELAPATSLYWSKAPVWGHLPDRPMRGHSATLVDHLIWQIGGCDHYGVCFADILCFNAETMQWFHPETTGEAPPPCRAHSATAVGHRIFVFGGGQETVYYNHLYVLDTYARKWTKVTYPPDAAVPIPRRAHTTWVYQGRLYMFGGGNGTKALNDVWALNVNAPYEEMRWESVEVHGVRKPGARGYHSASLVKDVVVVIGGSDGTYVFDDVWVLHLGRMQWYPIEVDVPKRLLGHTATQVGSYLFVIGGHNGTDYSSELELFNLVNFHWEPRSTRGRAPSIRGYHRSVLYDSRIFVMGGFDGMHVYEDVYVLDLAAAAYLPQVANFVMWPESGGWS